MNTPRRSVTVLVENSAARQGLGAEHGMSFWVESDNDRILFDTGQSDLFARNALCLGIDLATAAAIVLSHGHYDHTGGLKEALRLCPRARVHVHPAAFGPKFTRRDDGTGRSIGMPNLTQDDIRSTAVEMVNTTAVTEIVPGCFVTGSIPRTNSYEDTGGPFFVDAQCSVPDPLEDDQAVFFRCTEGIVILLGCAHAGVVNTIEHVRAVAGGGPIHAILGGMHLRSASQDRIGRTIQAFRDHDIRLLAPAHCTGPAATRLLAEHFPGRCRQCHTGDRFDFV
jgi:7,8-dihydropterin-6-yl-methyl-4-(beta-D-ribofuranosyl)aminobenzene 5'-phosphate synthase